MDECPADDAGVSVFGLVAEFGFALLQKVLAGVFLLSLPRMSGRQTYSLEDLFPPHVLQPRVQVLDFLHQRLDLVLVRALDPARLSDRHVKREFDCAVYA